MPEMPQKSPHDVFLQQLRDEYNAALQHRKLLESKKLPTAQIDKVLEEITSTIFSAKSDATPQGQQSLFNRRAEIQQLLQSGWGSDETVKGMFREARDRLQMSKGHGPLVESTVKELRAKIAHARSGDTTPFDELPDETRTLLVDDEMKVRSERVATARSVLGKAGEGKAVGPASAEQILGGVGEAPTATPKEEKPKSTMSVEEAKAILDMDDDPIGDEEGFKKAKREAAKVVRSAEPKAKKEPVYRVPDDVLRKNAEAAKAKLAAGELFPHTPPPTAEPAPTLSAPKKEPKPETTKNGPAKTEMPVGKREELIREIMKRRRGLGGSLGAGAIGAMTSYGMMSGQNAQASQLGEGVAQADLERYGDTETAIGAGMRNTSPNSMSSGEKEAYSRYAKRSGEQMMTNPEGIRTRGSEPVDLTGEELFMKGGAGADSYSGQSAPAPAPEVKKVEKRKDTESLWTKLVSDPTWSRILSR